MKHKAIPMVLLAGTVAVPAGLAFGADEGSEVDALRQQVEQLSRELDQVKNENDDNWLTEARAEEIRGLVNDVLADADTRTSLMQSGMTAGHDGKFFISSADGNWRLNIGGQLQVRWALNSTRNPGVAPPANPDNQQWGFEIPRAKLELSGHIVDPTWQFKVQMAYTTATGGITLEDAWVKKDLENGFALRAGQFKAPTLREELVDSKYQLAVERSLLNETYTQGRSLGIEAQWSNDMFRGNLYFGNGLRTVNSPYNGAAALSPTEFAVAGRFEWQVMGNWDQWDDFTAWSGDDHGLMFGAAAAYQKGAFGTASGATSNAGQELTQVTVDASWEMHPFNVFAYAVYATTNDTRVVPAGTRGRGLGGVVQAGWHMVPDQWELFGRYEWGQFRGNALFPTPPGVGAISDLSVATVGVNYYLDGHNAKWTTDFGWSFTPLNAAYSSAVANYRPTTNTGEYVVRSQFQILF